MEVWIGENDSVRAGSYLSGTIALTEPLEEYDWNNPMTMIIAFTGWETSVVSMPEDPERDETSDAHYLTRKCCESHLFYHKGIEVPIDAVTAHRRVPVPFRFDLPSHLPGTMKFVSQDPKENSVLPSQCSILYSISAEVCDTERSIKEDVKVLGSLGTGNEVDESIHFYAGASVPLTTGLFCGLFGLGPKKVEAFKLIASEEPICLNPGQIFKAILPDSATKLLVGGTSPNAIKIELTERVTWKARKKERSRSRIWKLAPTFVDAENMDDNHNFSDSTDVLEVLVDIPPEMIPSYQGDSLEVRHEWILGIQNDVSGVVAITNKIPVHVVRMD
jgi:hypothetical protein